MNRDDLTLLPRPASLARRDGSLRVDRPLRLIAEGDVPAAWVTAFARGWLERTGCGISNDGDGVALDVRVASTIARPIERDADESYRLEVDPRAIKVDAPNRLGLARAGETLLQLVVRHEGVPHVPCMEVADWPRFGWRGLMVDVARHFLPIGDLLRVLGGMAAMKLNVLHLHLSDDQGFRFPSRRFPRLAELGSGGLCYERDDLSRLVDRAADLGIRVVPELDMPGHCTSWLPGHPELASTPAPSGAWRRRPSFGGSRVALDPTRETTFEIVAGVLEDVAEVLPDRFVHIGGDEVHPRAWIGDAHIEAFMAAHGMADQHALQAHFTRRVVDILERLGRRAIVWDEALDDALPASVVVQAWRGVAALERALAAGREVIFSSPWYLDLNHSAAIHYRFDPDADPAVLRALEASIADEPGYERVAAAYRAQVAASQAVATVASGAGGPRHGRRAGTVLGGEACQWSEIVDAETIDLRVFSRLPAIAERLWSPSSCDDVDDLHRRLPSHLDYLARNRGLSIGDHRRAWLHSIGVEEPEAIESVLAQFEPVKWYARLLGDELAVRSGESAAARTPRPYNAATPLDRVVDHTPPESLAARAVAAAIRSTTASDGDQGRLAHFADQLHAAPSAFRRVAHIRQLAELHPLADDCAALGAMIADRLADAGSTVDRARIDAICARECAELWFPAARVVRTWLLEAGDRTDGAA